MITATIPANEKERLKAVLEYSILDTLPEKEFDDISKIASAICRTPISLISLIDSNRQWYKSKVGVEVSEIPREISFCNHSLNSPSEILLVPDLREDDRFFDNPFVTSDPQAVFYAGVPLVDSNGFALGSICVVDHVPRQLSKEQQETLRALSNQVVRLLELRKVNQLLENSKRELNERYKELEKFSYVVSHDIKSPLNNIIALSDILKTDYGSKVEPDASKIFDFLSSAANQLKNYVEAILTHYTGLKASLKEQSSIHLHILLNEFLGILDSSKSVKLILQLDQETITANEPALRQIMMNMLSNAIKYNDKAEIIIEVAYHEKPDKHLFRIKDNGMGIPAKALDKIFDPFTTLGVKDRFNKLGTGIGLSTVKQLIEKMGGEIQVISKESVGSIFEFTISK